MELQHCWTRLRCRITLNIQFLHAEVLFSSSRGWKEELWLETRASGCPVQWGPAVASMLCLENLGWRCIEIGFGDRGISQILRWCNWKRTCPSAFFFFFFLICQETSLIYFLNWCWKFSSEYFPKAFWEITNMDSLPAHYCCCLEQGSQLHLHTFFLSAFLSLESNTECLKWSQNQACEWASNIQLQIFTLCCQCWCWNEIQCELYTSLYLQACGNNIVSYVIELNNGKSLVSEHFHIATSWKQRS